MMTLSKIMLTFEIMTSFSSLGSQKNSLKKKLTVKIHAIYGRSCVLNITDFTKNT